VARRCSRSSNGSWVQHDTESRSKFVSPEVPKEPKEDASMLNISMKIGHVGQFFAGQHKRVDDRVHTFT
jgi:hypothetical protein